jgi:DNA adenine methylase
MESLAQSEPLNLKIVFGFTDSIFLHGRTNKQMQDFIQICKNKLGVVVELKNIFTKSIFYAKKNRYVAWTGDEKDESIIKGLDGLSNTNPLWIRKWFKKILIEIVKHPETRFEAIPKMIEQAYNELDSGRVNPKELKFTQRLKLYPYEYNDHVRTGILAKQLGKEKGDIVHWYETSTEKYIKSKQCLERRNSYAIKPENLNLKEYKNLLLNKLKDTLEITGFNTNNLGLSHHNKSRLKDNKTMLTQISVDLRDVHPFVKWAGGKSQLLPELNKLIPSQFNSYFEPFLGGGAMFFYLVSRGALKGNAYLSDANVDLITTYKVIKVNPKGVIELLQKYGLEYKQYQPYSEQQQKYYYRLRDVWNKKESKSDVERAAVFIALNRTCFNGLWRVNNRGEFNVPPGKYKNPLICDSRNLENVSNALANATILADDYRNVTQNAQEGDFIYLDPPYQPLNDTSNFTAYTKNGFDDKDQLKLAEVFRKLDSRGCLLLLSNSDTPLIRDLYSNFSIKEVNASRAINSKASRRKGHRELLISNYST